MMSTATQEPATTPIPVQLSALECTACIFPPLAMPKRGPQCTLGDPRVLNRIWWVRYTGMPWQGLPVPTDTHGKPAIHYPTVDTVFAPWADEGSLWQAFSASVAPLSKAQHRDVSVRHGDGTHTVAKTGAMAWATRGTHPKRVRTLSPSRTTMALS